jgi:hypothetical protein
MNRSNEANYLVLYSISEGLIARQYSQKPRYYYPKISGETPIWTVVTWPSIQYNPLIQMAVLKVNIVKTHSRCTLKFSEKLQYEPW